MACDFRTARPWPCTSRGSTSEALAHIIEQKEGIKLGKVSFVPGAEVRATAAARQRQGRAARYPEQELRDARGAEQVRGPADAGDLRQRRGAVCQHQLAAEEPAVRADPARGDPHGLARDQEGPELRAERARAPGAGARPAGRAREGALLADERKTVIFVTHSIEEA